MHLPHPGPSSTPAEREEGQPDPSTATRPDREGNPRADAPTHDDTERDAGVAVHGDVLPHDTRIRRLRLRLSAGTQEAIRSFAEAHGISEAGLLDALFHGLETADQGWLDDVAERARRMDAYHRDARARTDDPPPA